MVVNELDRENMKISLKLKVEKMNIIFKKIALTKDVKIDGKRLSTETQYSRMFLKCTLSQFLFLFLIFLYNYFIKR